jgi:hypothetical protein
MATGYGAGLGFTCASFSASQASSSYGYAGYGFSAHNGCGALVHLVPLDFPVGELHLDLVPNLIGGFGVRLGTLLGSKFFRVGGPASPVAIAIRGELEAGVQTIAAYPTSCAAYYTYGSTSCPNPNWATTAQTEGVAVLQGGGAVQSSYALTRALSLEGTLAAGVSVWLASTDIGGTGVAPYFTAILGVRL